VKLITHLHLVPRSRMRGALPPFPQYAYMAWCSFKAQRQIYLLPLPLEIHVQRQVLNCKFRRDSTSNYLKNFSNLKSDEVSSGCPLDWPCNAHNLSPCLPESAEPLTVIQKVEMLRTDTKVNKTLQHMREVMCS
jgi:hypothetical protein